MHTLFDFSLYDHLIYLFYKLRTFFKMHDYLWSKGDAFKESWLYVAAQTTV